MNKSDIGSAGRAPLYLEEGNQRVNHVSTHGGNVQTREVGNDNLKLVARAHNARAELRKGE